jgi:ribosomal protein S18 acetylase RimI-like enzyme
MEIRLLGKEEALPINLLLEADPSEKLVREYCAKGRCYAAEEGQKVIGTYVLLPLSADAVEIKNVAVEEALRGQGLGKKLVLHALAEAERHGFCIVRIGTGNSSFGQLALYQKCGFRMVSIDADFFTRNYPEPIMENGILCQDMILLEYKIR